ncbi:MAG: PHP-associated domain-containing protein, partial [Candidatus Caldatribacteriaceae bacterium]
FLATETIVEIEKVLQSCREKNMVLEINTAGLYKPVKEVYPSFDILEKARRMGLQVCFGSDAHKPQDVGRSFDVAVTLARKAGFQSFVAFHKREKISYPL